MHECPLFARGNPSDYRAAPELNWQAAPPSAGLPLNAFPEISAVRNNIGLTLSVRKYAPNMCDLC